MDTLSRFSDLLRSSYHLHVLQNSTATRLWRDVDFVIGTVIGGSLFAGLVGDGLSKEFGSCFSGDDGEDMGSVFIMILLSGNRFSGRRDIIRLRKHVTKWCRLTNDKLPWIGFHDIYRQASVE